VATNLAGTTGGHLTPVQTLTVIGSGRLGSVLPRLLVASGQVRPGQVFNPNLASARDAAAFITATLSPGDTCSADIAVDRVEQLCPADLWLLAVPDDRLAAVAGQLAALPLPWQGRTVFHCSGILSSSVLAVFAHRGARIASVHPAHSFADRHRSLASFAGSFCCLEGQPDALTRLTPLFEAIGGRPLVIDRDHKALYHAAMATAANHLVALLESSLRELQAAGIEPDLGRQLIAPLVKQTAANVFAQGTAPALTGPIQRGDADTIASHLDAISKATPGLLASYRALGLIALEIARQPASLSAATRTASKCQRQQALARIEDLLLAQPKKKPQSG